jgi:hypothetical protein
MKARTRRTSLEPLALAGSTVTRCTNGAALSLLMRLVATKKSTRRTFTNRLPLRFLRLIFSVTLKVEPRSTQPFGVATASVAPATVPVASRSGMMPLSKDGSSATTRIGPAPLARQTAKPWPVWSAATRGSRKSSLAARFWPGENVAPPLSERR